MVLKGFKVLKTFKGFDAVEVGLNSIMEENNANKEQGNKKRMLRRTWNKEVNKLVMKCYLMSEPSKRGFRRRMYGIWQDIGIFEITEQCPADQVRVIKGHQNGCQKWKWRKSREMEKWKTIVI